MGERVRPREPEGDEQRVSERLLLSGGEVHLPSPAEAANGWSPGHDSSVPIVSPNRHRPGHPAIRRFGIAARGDATAWVRKILAETRLAIGVELDRGLAFLLVPVFLAVGVIVYFLLPAEPNWMQPSLSALVLAAIVLATRSRPTIHLSCGAVLLVVLGILAAKAETWRMERQTLGAEVSTHLSGRVVSIEGMSNGRVRLTIDVLSTQRPQLRYPPDRVRLSARSVEPGTRAGSIIRGYVRLLPPGGPVRPGGYDFSFDAYFAGIGASGFFLSNPRLETATAAPLATRFWNGVEATRDRIAQSIRQSIGGPEGEIAAALIVGVRAGIPEEINEAMRKTGIYHIISISGLHMALVAGTVMALLRGAFALFPNFSSRHPVKKYAAATALAATAAYLLISGLVVAAERSFIMLAVMLLAVLFDRAALTIRNLAISAVAVILISPHEVMGPSFQMSFAATAALVGAYAAWGEHRARQRNTGFTRQASLLVQLMRRILVGLAAIAMTSIIAGGATTLYAIWHFQRVAPLSLFANLTIMPIVSLIVMPFAVLGAALMPFGADFPFLYVMGKGLTAVIAIADWIAAYSPVDAVGLISGLSVVLVTVGLVIATMATTWLRALALPFAAAGLLTLHQVRAPDVLVSEDARLVAMPIGGGELAVSRARPNSFTLDNWRRALDAEKAIPPERPEGDDLRLLESNVTDLPPGTPFLCMRDLCIARHISGAFVATAKNAVGARPACGFASLLVIEDATAKDPCRDPLVAVVTARDLARLGSAAAYFDARVASAPATVRFAIERGYRPWHMQRKFSREARGLKLHQPKAADG